MTTPTRNPFDIVAKAGASSANVHVKKDWDDEEQSERLTSYYEIPKKFWPNIRHGDHVRFYWKNNEYNNGGFVEKNPEDRIPNGGDSVKRFMILKSGFGKDAVRWSVAYEDFIRIFVKIDAVTLTQNETISDSIQRINDNLIILSERIEKLKRGSK